MPRASFEAGAGFRSQIHPERESVRVAGIGERDLAAASTLSDCLQESLDVGFRWIRVNLSRVSFMDSAGLGVLNAATAHVERAGGQLDVLHARGQLALAGVGQAADQRAQAGMRPSDSGAISSRRPRRRCAASSCGQVTADA